VRSLRQPILWMLIVVGMVAVSGSCKRDEPDKPSGAPKHDRPQRKGPTAGTRWPPPGAFKTPPPPPVRKLMERMVNVFATQQTGQVSVLFVNRQDFLGLSECEPAQIIERVMNGVKRTEELVAEYGGKVTWKGFTETYLMEVKRGRKPAECRAKLDLQLFRARFKWQVVDKIRLVEVHMVRATKGGAWKFVRLDPLE
jgi:hypothetical protein